MNFKAHLAATALALSATSASALIVDVSGPNSSVGNAPVEISNPDFALDDDVTNNGMQGFNEQQAFTLQSDLKVDATPPSDPATTFGTIATGTVVNSHMIFLNSSGNTLIEHFDVEWTFDGDILGVMSDMDGIFEAASRSLGATGTTYPNYDDDTFRARGLDNDGGGFANLNGDGYSVADNVLTISMAVTEPGDWVRVVTAPVPLGEHHADVGVRRAWRGCGAAASAQGRLTRIATRHSGTGPRAARPFSMGGSDIPPCRLP